MSECCSSGWDAAEAECEYAFASCAYVNGVYECGAELAGAECACCERFDEFAASYVACVVRVEGLC